MKRTALSLTTVLLAPVPALDAQTDEAAGDAIRAAYVATGSTDALIWVSRSSGYLLREEEDGDIAGKDKGHISYRWSSKRSTPAGAR